MRALPPLQTTGGGNPTARNLVGRPVELAEMCRLLDDACESLAALCLYGPAGAGKSTLVMAGARLARERGFAVLACRPAQSEANLSFAALADLLAGVPEPVLSRLPPAQRQALDVVLLRAQPEPGDAGTDLRTVATAALSAIRGLVGTCVLLAVDDVQWLDASSTRVLEFVARRLTEHPVAVLTSLRCDGAPGPVLALDHVLPPERRRELLVGPLSMGALHRLVRDCFGHSLPRPTLVALAEVSGGNPFYALEIARALDDAPYVAGEPLPVPQTLRELVAARIAALPADTSAALLVAAVAGSPSVELLTAVSGDAAAALEPAFVAGVAQLDNGLLRFTHPLLAAGVRAAAGSERLREVHRRLSVAGVDPEERARHLAECTESPDEDVATRLEDAARDARRRAAPAVAAELARHAVRLTPVRGGEDYARRSIAVAEYLLEAGDAAAARVLLTATVEVLPPSVRRAQAYFLLAMMAWLAGQAREARALGAASLTDAAGDRLLTARAHAWSALFSDDAGEQLDHAESALRLLDEGERPGERAFALFQRFSAEVLTGHPPRMDLFEQALALEPRAGSYEGSLIPGLWAMGLDDFPVARERFLRMLRHAEEAGDESTPAGLLPHLAELELWAGDWPRARAYVAEALVAAEQTGQSEARARRVQALVDAYEGELGAARATGLRQLEAAESAGGLREAAMWLAVLGFVELSAGAPGEADRWFSSAEERLATLRMREPFRLRHAADHIEAVIALGELERAESLLRRLEERNRILPRPWITATAARCRALLAAGRGDHDGALAEVTAALGHCAVLSMPFEDARTHLVSGQVHRRRREKRAAAEALQTAADLFEALGATAWAERTRSELGRVGLRPSAPLGLTETERRVAELAATGRTNRDVAGALFLSPKTVEANLSRAYQKLGIRSRAELGAVMASAALAPTPDRDH